MLIGRMTQLNAIVCDMRIGAQETNSHLDEAASFGASIDTTVTKCLLKNLTDCGFKFYLSRPTSRHCYVAR